MFNHLFKAKFFEYITVESAIKKFRVLVIVMININQVLILHVYL